MPRPSPSSRAESIPPKVVALGGGHGLAAVVRALREQPVDLTVVVTIADDGGSSGELRRQREGPAFGDMRQSLIASSAAGQALARAFERLLTINRLGRHPIGNLMLRSMTDAFGDLESASAWLGEQLGSRARVLPATSEPVTLVAERSDGGLIVGESAINHARSLIRRLRFVPDRPRVPDAVIASICCADWILIAPGSLFTSVLASCGVPDIACAISRTPARVIWISNLVQDGRETAMMSAGDHLESLRLHGVHVDTLLFDTDAELCFEARALAASGIEPVAGNLKSQRFGEHDPALLGSALSQLLASRADPSRDSEPSR